MIEIFGEFVVGSVRITLEGEGSNEDVEGALTDILRQYGYRGDEICSFLAGDSR